MSGTLTRLGGITIGGVLPGFNGIYAGVLADLNAKLAGLVALEAQLTIRPPSLSVSLEMALQLVAALRASIALGLPGVDFQVAAVAALLVEIRAKIAILVGLPLGTAGVEAYAYAGDTASFAPAVSSVIGPGLPGGTSTDETYALIFASRLATTIDAMKIAFVH